MPTKTFEELSKLFPAKNVHGGSHFETRKKSRSSAPGGMMINYRVENMNLFAYKEIFKDSLDHNEIGVSEMHVKCDSNGHMGVICKMQY